MGAQHRPGVGGNLGGCMRPCCFVFAPSCHGRGVTSERVLALLEERKGIGYAARREGRVVDDEGYLEHRCSSVENGRKSRAHLHRGGGRMMLSTPRNFSPASR
jgi:hypothetical protein